MTASNGPFFPLGQLTATPAALAALAACGQLPDEFLHRHQAGDYGVVDDEDKKLNDEAVRSGERVLSAYMLNDDETKVWIITEADRSSTTLLLPSDY